MEVRRRHTKAPERVAVLAPPTAETPGLISKAFDVLIWIFNFVARLLCRLVYGAEEDETQDEGLSGVEEESTLLGYLADGGIAVRLQRRRKTQCLVLDCPDEDDAMAKTALNHVAAAYTFLGRAKHAHMLESPGPPVILAHAPNGTVAGFLSATPTYPHLTSPPIPTNHASLALPLHWLHQTTTALEFLHAEKLTHGRLSTTCLYLDAHFNIKLADLTLTTWNGHNNGVPLHTGFHFPAEALRYDYFDGEPSANSQALGLAGDVFDFGTLAYTLLCRKEPGWELPTGNGTWALEELHEALDQAAPELGDEIVVGYLVRDAWCLVYEEGRVLREDFEHALLRQGFAVDDGVGGVREGMQTWAEESAYQPVWEF